MRPACWPHWLDETWAKSAEKGVGGHPETLAEHTWLVLERLADFAGLHPTLPEALGTPRLWHILFWAAFLHDFGKAASGFQNRLRNGALWPHRHEVLSLAFVDWLTAGLSAEEPAWIAAVVVCHHKDAKEIAELYPPPDTADEDQLAERVAELSPNVVRGLWRWISECAQEWVKALGMDRLGVETPVLPPEQAAVSLVTTQGGQRIYHWLRIGHRLVRNLQRDGGRGQPITALMLRGSFIRADQSASAHVGRLPHLCFTIESVLRGCGLDRSELFPHQRQAGCVVGSALLSAPTGSGKTEAALLWAARQATDRKLPRLFYTLPYQASMNAMALRLARIFGDRWVGLQHGRSLLALYRQLLEKEYHPAAAAHEAQWASTLARLNYPPVRVFSPYQMLKATYRLKGYEAMLSDYFGAAFIFDEIHAYEVRRLALILATVRYLANHFDARFLVMSATLPRLIKDWLRTALGNPTEIVTPAEIFTRFRRHKLFILDDELASEEALERIIADACAGKSVLVACNRVDRAQAMYQELRRRLAPRGTKVLLLHSRFNSEDRLLKEREVRETAGSTSQQRRPIVLVATQVVEVSLDIDLDTIYSDPAPMEALVQRFGRINRRGKQAALAPVNVFRQPDDGQGVYDPVLVQATLKVLELENGHAVDESEISGWLDNIYSGEIAARWQQEFQRETEEFEDACVRELRAFDSDSTLESLFYKAFDSIEVLPKSLDDRFLQLRETDPIRAYELLVPISWRRYCSLSDKGLIRPGERTVPPIVLTGYSPELGLTFEPELAAE